MHTDRSNVVLVNPIEPEERGKTMAIHRKPGHVGSFTIHAPEDYRPRHAAHVCTESCDPGNCEVQHYWEFYIPESLAGYRHSAAVLS